MEHPISSVPPKSQIHNDLEDFSNYVVLQNFQFSYILRFNLVSGFLALHQSELVRKRLHFLSPQRIRNAKHELIKISIEQSDLFSDYINYFHRKYIEVGTFSRLIPLAAVLINASAIKFYKLESKASSKYSKLLRDFEFSSLNTENPSLYKPLLNSLSLIKQESIHENLKENDCAINMAPYSITEFDIYPWLASKFSSPLKYSCKTSHNFSTLICKNYLNIHFEKEAIKPSQFSKPNSNYKYNQSMHKTFEKKLAPQNSAQFKNHLQPSDGVYSSGNLNSYNNLNLGAQFYDFHTLINDKTHIKGIKNETKFNLQIDSSFKEKSYSAGKDTQLDFVTYNAKNQISFSDFAKIKDNHQPMEPYIPPSSKVLHCNSQPDFFSSSQPYSLSNDITPISSNPYSEFLKRLNDKEFLRKNYSASKNKLVYRIKKSNIQFRIFDKERLTKQK
ncbi:hypothetical protein AYI68_g1310 [Smittium mucronatum]|uniref:Uncharacterized protein n=1 Tax=Smittium mucronatum TaxID=133383 RepID=A0A1R0H610_9FUNG|nr:hypothetical protein AYI68_g1310 [Smittium mucronatum]